MRVDFAEEIYQLFDEFIEKFILSGHSILTDNNDIFNLTNVNQCINLFVDNAKDDKRNFEEKIKEQFNKADIGVRIVFAHANWLWAMSVTDMTVLGKKRSVSICLTDGMHINDRYFKEGIGSGGTFHKQNKYWEIVFNLKLFKYLIENRPANIGDCKDTIEKICLCGKYRDKFEAEVEFAQIKNFTFSNEGKSDSTCAMYNVLLHLANPDKYERIISNAHKNQIVESFQIMLQKEDADKTIDERIAVIRKAISDSRSNISNFDFYDNDILRIWNPIITDKEYSEYQALKYKKAIILYGPPGTGKTYSANVLAESFIIQEVINKDKSKVRDFFDGKLDVSARIHNLQLHANYTYEDFIAGMQLSNGRTEPRKGYFFKLCESIKSETDKSPHVLILDEINRVDLSRLFGEIFSGIENREKEIDLPIGDFKVQVPSNLFIIGTMNEIDFSLEQLDFALRRRFVWFFYGFNKNGLEHMIEYKLNKDKELKIDRESIERFIENARILNYEIAEIDELGKQYEIGHAFFSEIIDIAQGFKGKDGYLRKVPLFKENGPVNVLWNISIKPIIEAFLGNLDKSTFQEKLNRFEGIFLNGK